MARHHERAESYGWLATAYHESGHAVAALMLGRVLLRVEINSPSTGVAWVEDVRGRLAHVVDEANQRRRVPPELLRLWREEFWISDAGAVAEAEFNLVPQNDLARGSIGDMISKAMLIPDAEAHAFVKAYYHFHVGAWQHLITEACRAFFRQNQISSLTRTLAEALLRARHLNGDEVIDVLLSNRAALTGQTDLFWTPVGDDPFARRRASCRPAQLRFVGV